MRSQRLYLGKGQFEDLLKIYEKKLELTNDGDERIAIQSKIGQLYEDEVKDDKKAIGAYMAILDAAGDEPIALSSLDRIYVRNQQWKELADILGRQITIIGPEDNKAAHVELKYRLGQLKEQQPRRSRRRDRRVPRHPRHRRRQPEGARLARDPSARQRQASSDRRGHPRARLRAAPGMGPARRRPRDPARGRERLAAPHVAAAPHRRAAAHQAARRREGVRRLRARVPRGSVDRSRQGAARVARPADRRRLGPAGQAVRRRGRQEIVKDLDPKLAHELATKIARSYEDRLGNSAKAVEFFKKALSIENDDLGALAALESIFVRDEKYPELLDIYRKRIEIANEPEERLEFLFRSAQIHEEMLGAPEEAISTYQEILGQSPG